MSITTNHGFTYSAIIIAICIIAIVISTVCKDYIIHAILARRWTKYIGVISKVDRIQQTYRDEDGTDISVTWKVYMTYVYNGVTYSNVRLGNDSPFYKVGDNVNIYINPNNPKEFMLKMNLLDIMFPIVTIAALITIFVWVLLSNQ